MNSNTIQPRHDTNASSAFSQALGGGATLTALLLATLLMSVPSVTLAQDDADDHTTQAELDAAVGGDTDHTTQAELDAAVGGDTDHTTQAELDAAVGGDTDHTTQAELNTHNTDADAHGGATDHTTQAELDTHSADTTAHGGAKAAADTAQARANAAHDLAEKAEGDAEAAQSTADDADGAAEAAQMTADANLDKLGEGASNSNRNIHIGVRAGTADTQGADAIAIGTDSSATGDNGVAIGTGSSAGENGVAIGNSVAAGANEIVIGNVADTVTIAGININELDQSVTELDQRVTTNRAGIAMAFAFAHLPTVQGGGWGIAAGSFESETAFAIGAHFELDNNVHLKVGGSASSDGEDSGFGIGFSKGW